jgi:membrane fusion protein (multidrug efflux system)
MRIGQPATLRADLYGRSVTYRGRVIGISPGTGSVFALLPPQNASGNWIKIVQRLPVRIALDPAELAASPLRVGLSMAVEVDLHDQSGPVLEAPGKSATATPAAARDPSIEALITRTIADSVGHGGAGSR